MGRTLLLQPGGRERRGTTRILAKACWQLCRRIGDAQNENVLETCNCLWQVLVALAASVEAVDANERA